MQRRTDEIEQPERGDKEQDWQRGHRTLPAYPICGPGYIEEDGKKDEQSQQDIFVKEEGENTAAGIRHGKVQQEEEKRALKKNRQVEKHRLWLLFFEYDFIFLQQYPHLVSRSDAALNDLQG